MEIPFLAVPHDTTTVIVDLTTLALAATHLFADDASVKKYVWFEGKYAAVDTELQSVKENLDVYGKTFFDDICGMTPLQYRDYVQKVYEQNYMLLMLMQPSALPPELWRIVIFP